MDCLELKHPKSVAGDDLAIWLPILFVRMIPNTVRYGGQNYSRSI
jgi:hypothetical protein